MTRINQRFLPICCAWALTLAALGSPAAAEPVRFKILVGETGVYAVTYEDLVRAGLSTDETATTFRLINRDDAVPVWRRGGQGALRPGDELVFRAEQLRGTHSYYHDHSRVNVYVLEIGGAPGLEMSLIPVPGAEAASRPPLHLAKAVHRERDLLLHRFFRRDGDPVSDDWFWHRLTQIDKEPFRLKVDLKDLDDDEPLKMRLAFRGWSRPRGTSRRPSGTDAERDPLDADHLVRVVLNDVPIGQAAWDAQNEYVLVIDQVPAAAVRDGIGSLEVSVPKRTPPGDSDPLIDVVLLNWIEIEHPRRGRVLRDQESLERSPGAGPVVLTATPATELLLFSDDGSVSAVGGEGNHHTAWLEDDLGSPYEVTVVRNEAFRSPELVVRDRPSDLRAKPRQADYLILAHPTLMEAIEPLAAFHRQRGLTVEVIDVFDAYDEFSHGIVEPSAIRDLIAHAHSEWLEPAPRFVLLVGDASWDTKNPKPSSRNYVDWTYQRGEVQQTPRNQLTTYEEGVDLDRNLIPTWKHQGAQGHAASDNYFVAITGDDYLPDLAIGRLPVVEPGEVTAIVDKTIRYATESDVGPWRRNLLWIANESDAFQRQSDEMAATTVSRGFGSTKIYPSPEEADNVGHQQALLESFNEGQLVVHFLGHGGRYIWRTGPPDFRKNHDLFTLEHLDELAPTERLPIILSMTCYSAPFDHPTADSIGEKFLRLADKGAVAVLAASWRNSPGVQLSGSVLTQLLEGATVGEAVMTAKRGLSKRVLIETYNLLGDPAIVMPTPKQRLVLTPVTTDDGGKAVRVRSTDGEELEGHLIVDWLGDREAILLSERYEAAGAALDLAYPTPASGDPISVSAYLWDEASGRDGIGSLVLESLGLDSLGAEDPYISSPGSEQDSGRKSSGSGGRAASGSEPDL